MSVDVSSLGSSKPGSQAQDFELNLASIIDCFTVLITFLLASSAFLSIGILDAGVAAGTPAQETGTPPAIQINVELLDDSALEIKVSGKVDRKIKLAKKGDEADYENLTKELAQLKAQFSGVDALTLSASDNIEYSNVIVAMDKIRKTIPVVLLGGF